MSLSPVVDIINFKSNDYNLIAVDINQTDQTDEIIKNLDNNTR